MSELLVAISEFDAACEAADLSYVIGGSVCSGIHSLIRNTNDVDVVLGRALKTTDPAIAQLDQKFIVDQIALEQNHLQGRCYNIFHEESAIKFDLFPPIGEFQRAQLERAVIVRPTSSPRPFRIASVEDIIMAKLNWLHQSHSERQEQDILGLLSVNKNKIDFSYIANWSEKFSVSALLSDLRSRVEDE